ncbi:MAG: Type 1 glutamine amidotransferase-like domain-containing protein [Saprospiraceae bacterium]|nr:Type 1 glutamine amidotransferase-like domain-containing protein [Saprospiraceae bacterium]MDW8230395.1 Type 1 glutamine amidotransferase-like domain-containing protein [Saprospiraceae bacterium]
MRYVHVLLLWMLLPAACAQGQSYTRWVVGDTADVSPSGYVGGLVLAGGGTDNDDAMRWMLQRAGGGDVLVLRASGSNGYNSYFFSQLGVTVNSVETIRFNNAQAAYDPYVLRQIRNAELVFIAGGDQYVYYQYWKDTPVEEALNYLLLEKKITLAGTSAGMAILGQAYYAPSGSPLTSAQALANPFHANFDVLGWNDFLKTPFLANTITDTHYDQRERSGRHFAFLARLTHAHGERFYGIACNEYVAVCIDTTGRAIVFGDHPNYSDYAYFLKTNCQQPREPEVIQPNTPLTWNRQQAAVVVYAVPGTKTGANTFNLKTWESGTGGQWQHWHAAQGVMAQKAAPNGACNPTSSEREVSTMPMRLHLYPNPAREQLLIEVEGADGKPISLQLLDALGRVVWQYRGEEADHVLSVGHLPAGPYVLAAQSSYGASWGQVLLR